MLVRSAAFLIAMLAGSPALAQDGGYNSFGDGLRAPIPASEAAMAQAASLVGVRLAGAGNMTELTVAPAVNRYNVSFAEYQDAMAQFVNTTAIAPMMRWAEVTGDWIAGHSNAVIVVARNSGEWVAARQGVAVDAVHNAKDWIALSSMKFANATVAAVSGAFGGIKLLEDWSLNLLHDVKTRLAPDGKSEFALLVRESGFVLADIKVGMGLIPELVASFRHERDLTPEEKRTFQQKIREYTAKTSGAVGYFEGILLRNLVRAGSYAGGVKISQVHVDIFPLPGLEVFFDPFSYEEARENMLKEAHDAISVHAARMGTIEGRIADIEIRIPGNVSQ